MPVAALGPENPLPPLRILPDPRGGLDVSEADAEMAANLAYGHTESLLPYTFQDGYGRETADRELTTAVLENEILRAEFLLDYCRRLTPLGHTPPDRVPPSRPGRPSTSPTPESSAASRHGGGAPPTPPTPAGSPPPPTTSRRSRTPSAAGSPRSTLTAPAWSRPRRTCCAAASSSTGAPAP